ncbi:MAG TPA: nodulation protein NfeD [Candidatus Paceibacterota bacterium]|jgi:membrane-bound serine protease (ClpP class)|nr:nodulation protein NfeD [Verrucomicrobiota bacterium]HRY58143.1 nodulation protein NfeD [Candidatus Paceibacterota bacterium]HQE89457.1 nodulation protein NfeD [Verrucomicrobiota bacterium]HQH01290.1 nodulation protein NfeD [Verrucomicrobiota bacterium]HQJ48412.1 nodulation protein NfeD [Verrucomicrobiota bacterium]
MNRSRLILFGVLSCLAALAAPGAEVGLIKINGAIGPATASYITRAIEAAAERENRCLIIQLDTPGGSLESTKRIVQAFYASPVPTVVYVAPEGAWAGSAGCFITLAADVAAMAPATSIGAAHPVSIGPGGEEKTSEVMKEKQEQITGSFIEGIANRRGRNAEWARASVVESKAITADQALELHVIDLVAKDLPDLLRQLDEHEVNGKPLETADANVVEIPRTTQERLLQLLSHPELMMILMLVAIYGIIGELSNPGAILPGVVGAIALILVLYMATILPINSAGLALIGLSIVLFIMDIFAPSHGILTFGGIVSFLLGALMLFNRADPVFRLSLAYIIPATLVTAAFFIFVVGSGLRAQWLPVRVGREALLGRTAPARERIDAAGGWVFIEGEYWNAVSEVPIEPGQPVEIIAVHGLTLKVVPKQPPIR